MNIPSAIELLDSMNEGWPMVNIDEYDKAIRLGIEALKREKSNRENPDFVMVGKLPGETES